MFKNKKKSHPKELSIPEVVSRDSEATEIIRFWIVQGKPTIALNPIVNPTAPAGVLWGVLLADIARHATNALMESNATDQSPEDLQNEIMTTFNRELGFERVTEGSITSE